MASGRGDSHGSGGMSGDSRGLSTLVYWVGLRSLQLPTAKGEVEEDERDRAYQSSQLPLVLSEDSQHPIVE